MARHCGCVTLVMICLPFDLAALTLGPQSLIRPLAGVTVVMVQVLALWLWGETVTRLDWAATGLIYINRMRFCDIVWITLHYAYQGHASDLSTLHGSRILPPPRPSGDWLSRTSKSKSFFGSRPATPSQSNGTKSMASAISLIEIESGHRSATRLSLVFIR